ncbi:MAG: hypothetical protein WEB78_10715 [Ilumatobacteraceae bacterium]
MANDIAQRAHVLRRLTMAPALRQAAELDGTSPTDLVESLLAAEPWSPDEVVRTDGDGTPRSAEGPLEIDGMAVLDQAALQHATQRHVVLNHQHPHDHLSFHTDHEPDVKTAFTIGS